jgi:hypothetical protein
MNAGDFFAELKRRNVYKVAIPVVAWLVDRDPMTLCTCPLARVFGSHWLYCS